MSDHHTGTIATTSVSIFEHLTSRSRLPSDLSTAPSTAALLHPSYSRPQPGPHTLDARVSVCTTSGMSFQCNTHPHKQSTDGQSRSQSGVDNTAGVSTGASPPYPRARTPPPPPAGAEGLPAAAAGGGGGGLRPASNSAWRQGSLTTALLHSLLESNASLNPKPPSESLMHSTTYESVVWSRMESGATVSTNTSTMQTVPPAAAPGATGGSFDGVPGAAGGRAVAPPRKSGTFHMGAGNRYRAEGSSGGGTGGQVGLVMRQRPDGSSGSGAVIPTMTTNTPAIPTMTTNMTTNGARETLADYCRTIMHQQTGSGVAAPIHAPMHSATAPILGHTNDPATGQLETASVGSARTHYEWQAPTQPGSMQPHAAWAATGSPAAYKPPPESPTKHVGNGQGGQGLQVRYKPASDAAVGGAMRSAAKPMSETMLGAMSAAMLANLSNPRADRSLTRMPSDKSLKVSVTHSYAHTCTCVMCRCECTRACMAAYPARALACMGSAWKAQVRVVHMQRPHAVTQCNCRVLLCLRACRVSRPVSNPAPPHGPQSP